MGIAKLIAYYKMDHEHAAETDIYMTLLLLEIVHEDSSPSDRCPSTEESGSIDY